MATMLPAVSRRHKTFPVPLFWVSFINLAICKPGRRVDVAFSSAPTIALSSADQIARWHWRCHVSPISIACSSDLRPKQNIEEKGKKNNYRLVNQDQWCACIYREPRCHLPTPASRGPHRSSLEPRSLIRRWKFNLPAFRTTTPPCRISIPSRYLSGDSWRDRRLGDSLRHIDHSPGWLKTLPPTTPVSPSLQ